MNADLARTIVAADIDTWVVDPETPGVTWRLRVDCDTDTSTNDYETYGETTWTENNFYGPVRPYYKAGANAPHARVLDRNGRGGYYGKTLWWWPLPDVWGTTPPYDFAADFATAKRLMEDGFAVAILDRRTQCVCCGSDLIKSAAQSGIDVWPDADPDEWASIVDDLAAELPQS